MSSLKVKSKRWTAANEQAANEQAANEQAANEQAANEQAANEQAANEQAAPEVLDAGENASNNLGEIQQEIIHCRRCLRLVEWRESVAQQPPLRFRGETYWARPVPSFGDARARLFIVGLAPAAHGGNRTGRVFTGDKSGDWLFRALYKAGFSQSTAIGERRRWTGVARCLYQRDVPLCAAAKQSLAGGSGQLPSLLIAMN